jgi:hypothetical protein
MFQPTFSRRALSLAATAAAVATAALTAACNDGPLGPNTSARPAAAPAANRATPITPVPALVRATLVVTSNTNMKSNVPGTTVRFTTDKGSVIVSDNVNTDGSGDSDAGVGVYSVFLPFGSTHYKAEVLSVPIGYQLPTSPVYGTLTTTNGNTPETTVKFPTVVAAPKKQLVVSFLSLQKTKALGATVVVTAPGWDLMYTLTDGGAGDLRADGSQGALDGQVTVYAPASSISQWKVCETAAPIGYLLTEPTCQTVNVPASQTTSSVTLFHQTGIIVQPPSM